MSKPKFTGIDASGVTILARLNNLRKEIDLIEAALNTSDPAILSGGTQEPPKDPPK